MLLMFAANLEGVTWIMRIAIAMLVERHGPGVKRLVYGFGLGLTGIAVV